MAKEGWSASTFEVQTAKGGRWLIDMSSPKRSEALQRAEALLNLGKVEGVRVTEMREGWNKEKVVFERVSGVREKALQIDPVPDLQMCSHFSDYYTLPSRLTIGRVLRAYLDRHGLTALELMFNAAHLRALDRMDTFYPSAIQHVAQLQAKNTGHTKMERLDKLTGVFEKVLKRARKADEFDDFVSVLVKHGPDRALAKVMSAVDDKQQDIALYGMLAAHIADCGWAEKLEVAINMAEQANEPRAINLADEVIAEILDGKVAVEELFGGFSTPIQAWKVYMQLVGGRYDNPPRYMSPQIARLNVLFSTHDLPHSRTVLLRRISRGLGGTQTLSKDGRDVDRSSFIGLVRELTEPAGLHGGPDMVEAVVLRAKTLLGENGVDLPIETAIRQALYLMPSQAARLGMLLDLTGSDLGRKHDGLVRQQLLHLLNDLRNIYDLFPSDVQDEARTQGLDSLRKRLGMSALSDEFKDTLSLSLTRLLEGKPLDPEAPSNFKPDPKPQMKNGEMALAKGQVLFHEGEAGEAAYLIVEGSVEVYRMHKGKRQHLATLARGEIVGEMSLIDRQPRMASVCAAEDTQLVCISQKSLQDRLAKLEENDKVLHFLLKTVVRRLRGLARITE
jgi:hypothetical protein